MKNCRNITDAEIGKVADLHNRILDQVIMKLGQNPNPTVEQLHRAFYYCTAVKGFEKKDIEQAIDVKLDLEKSLDHFESYRQIQPYIDKVCMLVTSSKDLDALTSNLREVEAEVNADLNCASLDAILLLIKVTQRSANFWLSSAQGGSGKGFPILEAVHSAPARQYTIAIADGRSAAAAYIDFGVAGKFTGPSGSRALPWAVAYCAAWNSALAGFGII